MSSSTNDRLTEVFRTVFGDDAIVIANETTAEDIPEWDSLANVNLMFAVEQEFSLRFRDDDFAGFANVGELRRFLEGRS